MGWNGFFSQKKAWQKMGNNKKNTEEKQEKKHRHTLFRPVCTGAFSSSPGRTEANCLGF